MDRSGFFLLQKDRASRRDVFQLAVEIPWTFWAAAQEAPTGVLSFSPQSPATKQVLLRIELEGNPSGQATIAVGDRARDFSLRPMPRTASVEYGARQVTLQIGSKSLDLHVPFCVWLSAGAHWVHSSYVYTVSRSRDSSVPILQWISYPDVWRLFHDPAILKQDLQTKGSRLLKGFPSSLLVNRTLLPSDVLSPAQEARKKKSVTWKDDLVAYECPADALQNQNTCLKSGPSTAFSGAIQLARPTSEQQSIFLDDSDSTMENSSAEQPILPQQEVVGSPCL